MQAVVEMLRKEEEKLKAKCREEGKIEGKIEARTRIIEIMLQNTDIETISKLTKIPIEEVERIKKLKK